MTQAGQVADPGERTTLETDAQNLLLSGFYILPLYDQQNHFLLRSDVEGVRAMPTVSTPTFQSAWLNR